MIENKNNKEDEEVEKVVVEVEKVVAPVVPTPKVKKPRTEKQLAATARLLENNRIKRELLKKHKEAETAVVEPPVPVVPPVVVPPVVVPPVAETPKQKKVYKKRIVLDEKPKFIPPPLEEYSESSSDDEPQFVKPQRLARRFRIH